VLTPSVAGKRTQNLFSSAGFELSCAYSCSLIQRENQNYKFADNRKQSFSNSVLSPFECRISYSENVEGKGEENIISIVMNFEIVCG
jgi:hypothetical protein